MDKDYEEVRKILCDLTDVTGYVHDSEKHTCAFATAFNKLCELMDKIDNAERV